MKRGSHIKAKHNGNSFDKFEFRFEKAFRKWETTLPFSIPRKYQDLKKIYESISGKKR